MNTEPVGVMPASAVPARDLPPLTDGEIAEIEARAETGDSTLNDVLDLVASLRAAREELMRVRHALTVIQAARPPLAHSAAIVEQLALSIRAREMKPAQIASEEAERGYHNAINGYREVARAILRGIDKALTVEEGADRV